MRVLLIEDDEQVARSIELMLKAAGFNIFTTDLGEDGVDLGKVYEYDLIILDLGLPDISGYEVLKQLRMSRVNTPVLILSANPDIEAKVKTLGYGADDYLTKPFHIEELLARLRALIRRASGLASPVLACGGLSLDTRSGRVTLDGQGVTLTAHEYKLLAYLMHRPGAVVSRTELTEHLYAQDFERDSNTIEVFIARLRKKLPGVALETVRGLGYRLAPP